MGENNGVAPQISRRLLRNHLRKIKINNGDVLAVKTGTAVAKENILIALAEALGKVGKQDVIVVVVDSFTDLSVLDEKEMNGLGWYRVNTLKKMIHIKGKEAEDGENGA